MIASDIGVVLPELLLACYAMLALLIVVFTGKDRFAARTTWAMAIGMVALALYIALEPSRTPSGATA